MRGWIQQYSERNDLWKWLIFPLVIVLLVTACIVLTDLDYPFRSDEEHFIATIEFFGNNYQPGTALDYPEMTGPLFYYVYALWGKMSGFSPDNLRILNLLLSAVTFILMYVLYGRVLRDLKIVLSGMILLLLNPYYAGLSMHVFTDMSALLFIVLIALAVYLRNPSLLLISTACALLTRQYSVFLVISAAVYFFLLYRVRGRFRTGSFIALLCGVFPILALMLLWKGAAPPSGILRWVIDDGSVYRLRYIYIYIIFMTISLLPVLIYAYRTLLKNGLNILAGFLLSLTYFFLPVRSSFVTLEQTGRTTVGLMHGFMRGLLNNSHLEQFFLWIFCWAGFVTLLHMIRTDIKRMGSGECDFGCFLTLSVILFLLIMPFSYQVWEKYLVVVLPFALLRLLMMIGTGRKSS